MYDCELKVAYFLTSLYSRTSLLNLTSDFEAFTEEGDTCLPFVSHCYFGFEKLTLNLILLLYRWEINAGYIKCLRNVLPKMIATSPMWLLSTETMFSLNWDVL